MIGYVTLGTNNLPEAVKFYDAVFGEINAAKIFDSDHFVAWSTSETSPAFCICSPYDGNSATVGNGVMVAVAVKSEEDVKKLHSKALSLGGLNEGEPGDRNGTYLGYIRDLDGNKVAFFHPGAQ